MFQNVELPYSNIYILSIVVPQASEFVNMELSVTVLV